ncbi:MAG TPA: PLP-dependent aminotransferase family protein [Arenicellales bacterium]|nr:PLP-dependent aminotransferase family protein [Arenicellales bacterium]
MPQTTTGTERPLYDQVARVVRGMIDEGSLTTGQRVPSLRNMSRQLKVSITTVMQAYDRLEHEGLIEARPQSGYFVTPRAAAALDVPAPRRSRSQRAPRHVRIADTVQAVFSMAGNEEAVPLGVANPAAELLPTRTLTRLMRDAARRHPLAAANYSFPPGEPGLRREIALRSSSLGGAVSPDEVVITAGATEALMISLSAVARPGDVVAVESPTYFMLLQMIESLGMLALEIATDPATGMSVDELCKAVDQIDVKAVISNPNFHNPTGSLMPDAQKRRLVAAMSERSIPLIEDDIYGDLYFTDERPRTLKSFDRDGGVLLCSSFSKAVAPGYRVGWVLPGIHQEKVMAKKQVVSAATASLPQLAMAELLRSGAYDRNLSNLRRHYGEQVRRMRAAVAEYFPKGTRVSDPAGGFVLWVELPAGTDAMELFDRAMEHGIGITPGVVFSSSGKYRNFIRLNAGNPWDERIDNAVRTVGRLAAQIREGSRAVPGPRRGRPGI